MEKIIWSFLYFAIGVMRYESPNGYRVLQFKPNIRCMPIAAASQSQQPLQSKNQAALSIMQAEQNSLKLDLPAEEGMSFACIECDTPLDTKNHF